MICGFTSWYSCSLVHFLQWTERRHYKYEFASALRSVFFVRLNNNLRFQIHDEI